MSGEDELIIAKFRENQSKAAKLPFSVEVRSLIDQSLCYGTLATNSIQYEGYPTGSIVGFELNDEGNPFFVFSTMSAHTNDIRKDGKASLTITAKDFKGAAEGRVVLIGDVQKVDPTNTEVIAKLRDKYLARHKEAYWIDFGFVIIEFQLRNNYFLCYIKGFLVLFDAQNCRHSFRWRLCDGWKHIT